MTRTEIKKVRSSITKQREIEDLKNIPTKLIVKDDKPRDRRKTKKKTDYTFPKTGVMYVDDESSSEGSSTSDNYSG